MSSETVKVRCAGCERTKVLSVIVGSEPPGEYVDRPKSHRLCIPQVQVHREAVPIVPHLKSDLILDDAYRQGDLARLMLG
jgi:hypothetical protein